MRTVVRERRIVEKAVAQLLFDGLRTEKGGGTPTFNPATDEITTVSFVLTGATPSECKPQTGFTLSPDVLFAALPVERRPSSREALERSLGRSLARDCVFTNATNYAPIVTAESMLPAFVGQFPAERNGPLRLFDRTVLLVVSNDVYNGFPARELDDLRRRRGLPLNGIEDALRLTQRTAQHFLLESPEGWLAVADVKENQYLGLRAGAADFGRLTARLHMSELRPLGTDVTSVIDFPQTLLFDRVATGTDDVRVVVAAGERGDLRILRRARLEPLTLQIRNRTGDKQPGGAPVVVDLTACAPPLCTRLADELRINPLVALNLPQALGRGEPLPPNWSIETRVSFRYVTGGLYDVLRVHSEWTPVRMRFVPPLVIPGSSWSPDERRLDNATLTALWRPSDSGGLTQDAARVRVLAEREQEEQRRSALAIGGTLLAPVMLGLVCMRFFYRRPFHPRLLWEPADEPTLDFENVGRNRLLLGTMTIENEAAVPWFGRWLRNRDHPHRIADLTLSPPSLHAAGLEVDGTDPIGFLMSGDGERLADSITREITHGNQFPVFLAAERVLDFSGGDGSTAARSDVPLSFALSWRRRRGDARRPMRETVTLQLHLRRERPRPPRVRFVGSSGTAVVFERGKTKEVGTLLIESQARRGFAEAFTAPYAVLARRSGIPLGDGVLRILDNADILQVPSRAVIHHPVRLVCDGVQVPNPESSEDVYSFRLATEAAAGSELGPHGFAVQRDPSQCEPRLMVEWCGRRYDVFWPNAGDLAHATVIPAGDEAAASTMALAGNTLSLPNPTAEVHTLMLSNGGSGELLRLDLGNTGRSGRGVVSFEWEWTLAEDAAEAAVEMKASRPLHDMLALKDNHTGERLALPPLAIAEIDEDRSLHLAVESAAIAAIHGDRSGIFDLRGRIRLHRRNDQGGTWSGALELAARFRLEALPPPNWLCIDFGTSAIAAALGSGGAVKLIDLQRLAPPDIEPAIRQERNIAAYDPTNLEVGTPFLPSYVLCDADLRQGKATKHAKPGFPAFSPARYRPTDPTFLALPAPMPRLQEYPDRVIGSLKSWLGRSSATITLSADVQHDDADGNRVEGPLRTDEVVEGAFAALASAYLDDPRHHAGRVIVTHPNTFSPIHRDRLRRCVLAGLGSRLGIHLPERVELISESDAIAFQHCRNRLREGVSRPQERILVFDLGAGTLDLTLIKVDWAVGGHVRPLRWTVESRIGVPVAGNHLDRILAWQVDRLLRLPAVVDKDRFSYIFPLVSRSFTALESQNHHREAVRELALALRRAKQGEPARKIPPWDGKGPFLVKVGGNGPHLLRAKNAAAQSALPTAPDGDRPQLVLRDDEILLAIPAEMVRGSKPLHAFLDFLTRTCIDELLLGAGRTRADVDTVLVSGRGALWPGLRDTVVRQFPQADAPFLHAKPDDMKEAVVRGAIAWQQLTSAARSVAEQRPPRLAVLLHGDNRLIEEKDWNKPIDLSTSASFSLIQVECAQPDYGSDRRTLRRHFYVDVGFGELQRDELSLRDPTLLVRRERDRAGYGAIRLEGTTASKTLGIAGTAGAIAMRPPWPIGETLLNPDEPPEEE